MAFSYFLLEIALLVDIISLVHQHVAPTRKIKYIFNVQITLDEKLLC